MFRGVLTCKQSDRKVDDVIVLMNKRRKPRFVYGSNLKTSMPFELQGDTLIIDSMVLYTTDNKTFENELFCLQMNKAIEPMGSEQVGSEPVPAKPIATKPQPPKPMVPKQTSTPNIVRTKLSEGWCVWHTAPTFAPIFERQDLHQYLIDRLKSWERLRPNPKCTRVTDSKCRQMIVDLKTPALIRIYDTLIPAAYRADMWRLCALYAHGGLYTDLHILCQDEKALSALLEEFDYLFCVDTDNREFQIRNCWMFVKHSKSELLWSCINKIKENGCRKIWYDNPLEFTGSTLITKMLKTKLNVPEKTSGEPLVELELNGQRYGFLSYTKTSSLNYEISFKGALLMLCGYPNYRNDLRSLGCGEHYANLHKLKRIYF